MNLLYRADQEQSLNVMWHAYLAATPCIIAKNLPKNSATVGHAFLNARYYDSGRGQFLSQDPVFWEVGQTQDGKLVLTNPQAMNSYGYANGNPIIGKDPSGRMFGIDDAIAFAVGGVSAVAIQKQEYGALGITMTLADAAGAYVNGGIMGVGVVNIPETDGLFYLTAARLVAGAAAKNGVVAGAAGDSAKQLVGVMDGTQKSLSIGDFVTETAFSAASNAVLETVLPAAAITGINTGRGSWSATYKSVMTRFERGAIENVSARTSLKVAAAAQTAGSYKSVGGAVLDSIKTQLMTPSKSAQNMCRI